MRTGASYSRGAVRGVPSHELALKVSREQFCAQHKTPMYATFGRCLSHRESSVAFIGLTW